jgi:HJR/Mrr/RecB family endonuclease
MFFKKLKLTLIWYVFFVAIAFQSHFILIAIAGDALKSERVYPYALSGCFLLAMFVMKEFLDTTLKSRRFRRKKPFPVLQADIVSPNDMSGEEFERWVACKLAKNKWRTYITKKSGDQGIDVVATRYLKKVGIQCKRYKGSVGNAAIQQAFAGQAYYNLDHVAVVTTGYYTSSAKELAEKTGVLLLTPEDLPDLYRKIKSRK